MLNSKMSGVDDITVKSNYLREKLKCAFFLHSLGKFFRMCSGRKLNNNLKSEKIPAIKFESNNNHTKLPLISRSLSFWR